MTSKANGGLTKLYFYCPYHYFGGYLTQLLKRLVGIRIENWSVQINLDFLNITSLNLRWRDKKPLIKTTARVSNVGFLKGLGLNGIFSLTPSLPFC